MIEKNVEGTPSEWSSRGEQRKSEDALFSDDAKKTRQNEVESTIEVVGTFGQVRAASYSRACASFDPVPLRAVPAFKELSESEAMENDDDVLHTSSQNQIVSGPAAMPTVARIRTSTVATKTPCLRVSSAQSRVAPPGLRRYEDAVGEQEYIGKVLDSLHYMVEPANSKELHAQKFSFRSLVNRIILDPEEAAKIMRDHLGSVGTSKQPGEPLPQCANVNMFDKSPQVIHAQEIATTCDHLETAPVEASHSSSSSNSLHSNPGAKGSMHFNLAHIKPAGGSSDESTAEENSDESIESSASGSDSGSGEESGAASRAHDIGEADIENTPSHLSPELLALLEAAKTEKPNTVACVTRKITIRKLKEFLLREDAHFGLWGRLLTFYDCK